MKHKYSMNAQGEWIHSTGDKNPTKVDRFFIGVTSVTLLAGLIVQSVEVAFS